MNNVVWVIERVLLGQEEFNEKEIIFITTGKFKALRRAKKIFYTLVDENDPKTFPVVYEEDLRNPNCLWFERYSWTERSNAIPNICIQCTRYLMDAENLDV